MESKKLLLWVSTAKKILSFQKKAEFETVAANNQEEFWDKVYLFLDTGYRVQ